MKHTRMYSLSRIAVILAFIVIVLGAYTRLTDAGLGCPDWPGCYGHLTVVEKSLDSTETTKAWTEMVHRYAAGTLGLLVAFILLTSLWQRYRHAIKSLPIMTPILLTGLIIFQALLGMWTVTLKLHPLVVMGHLLGGMTLISLLCLLHLQLKHSQQTTDNPFFVPSTFAYWGLAGIIILAIQIALGGWVSSNYAGISCIGFPLCNGQWWPNMDWQQAFNFATPIGLNYEYGLLDSSARVTVQMVHRIWAVVTVIYLCGFALALNYRSTNHRLKHLAWVILGLCVLQVTLGIINVIHFLPLHVALSHNAVAALLLISLITANYHLFRGTRNVL